jgi:hypothetical protein
MKRVILRADDVCATTEVTQLRRVYDPCWVQGHPVCLAVIPASAYRFTPRGPEPVAPRPLGANEALCELLGELVREGLAEILLHGRRHHPGELARGTAAEVGGQLDAGLAALRETLPEAQVRVLVPPHDYCSPVGIAAARERGLEVCSTWAATRGGGRLAHWWGRARRLLGRPFAPPRDGLWPTDVTLLDFEDGDGARDTRVTERLLDRAEGWDAPLVLPHHPWRLQGAGYDRWLAWLGAMDARPDVAFVRFGDA